MKVFKKFCFEDNSHSDENISIKNYYYYSSGLYQLNENPNSNIISIFSKKLDIPESFKLVWN